MKRARFSEEQIIAVLKRKRPVETVVGNGRFRGAGGGTGMTGDGWEAAAPIHDA